MADNESSETQLRKLLRPRRRPPQPVVKGRQWVMSDRDIAAFVKILREHFPTIVFLKAESAGERRTKWELVPDPVAVSDEVYAVVPDDDWNAEAYCAQPSQPWGSRPWTSFRFRSHFGPFVRKLDEGLVIESMDQGTLRGGHIRSDRETARFLARVWRISEKITTNKIKEIDEETGSTIWPGTTTGVRYGFDALRWCLERDNRVLDWRYRPTDDWEIPDSPYYD